MSARQAVTNVAYALLKFGAIMYLFPVFWENIRNPDITGDIVIMRLLFWGISYLLVIFIILVISRENFSVFGFGIVLVTALYYLVRILVSQPINTDLALHFFIICICFYFMTKEYRSRRQSSPMF